MFGVRDTGQQRKIRGSRIESRDTLRFEGLSVVDTTERAQALANVEGARMCL